MLIRYYGHSLFTLETADGVLMAFDPFDEKVGYPLPKLAPQIVLMSHAHMDHANRALFERADVFLTEPGGYKPGKGILITGIAAFHDDMMGQKRGSNVLFKVEADGLTLLHLGDLGHRLTAQQLKAIGRVDILFLPVGGHYTIDAITAKEVMEQISPRVAIPMHYKTAVNPHAPISELNAFTRYFDTIPAPMPIVRVTKEDVACLPGVITMDRSK